ncbi:Uncharacterised protein [Mycobacteroides abscessus subsp. massiliense]|nr:Uncharacterised protein [Mycobacteroides abscessus subsp. massiliense]
MASCAMRSAPSTYRSISASAVSILRAEATVTRPRACAAALAVSNVPESVSMIGNRSPIPSTRSAIRGCSFSPPLRMIADSDGNPSATCALATASSTSDRSAGKMTACPSCRRSKQCSAVMPATMKLVASRDSSASSPLTNEPFTAFMSSSTDGETSSGTSGSTQAGLSKRDNAWRTSSS